MNKPQTFAHRPSPDEATAILRGLLAGPLACPRMDIFGPTAMLGNDLGLDSTAMMTLMLHLEEAGIDMPEDAFDQAPTLTVAALANLLAGIAPEGDEPLDIKVHCVVSCFCQALKDRGGIDHRPMYLGLWDGQVVVDQRMRLGYHAADIDHDFYCRWFRQLFGVEVTRWYDETEGKAANLAYLEKLLSDWRPGHYVMPMIDMFLLPQRDNKFAQDPFPHYALIEPTDDPETWRMRDSDFRWEGPIPAQDLRRAFLRETVAGGYSFDNTAAHPAARADVAAMFSETFRPHDTPLIDAVTKIVRAHVKDLPRTDLEDALRELPVIGIRKYAYEHALASFGDIEGKDFAAFEECCDRIAALHGGLNTIHRRAVAYARGGNPKDLLQVCELLEDMTSLELGIKSTLGEWFRRWQEAER